MRVANLGSGHPSINRGQILERWPTAEITCIDADPSVGADVVCDLSELAATIPARSFDGVFLSHILEHFYDDEVPGILAGISSILRLDGQIVVIVPSMYFAAKVIVERGLSAIAVDHPVGYSRALDMLYGNSVMVEQSRLMGHKTGFDAARLEWRMEQAGFRTTAYEDGMNVIGVGVKW